MKLSEIYNKKANKPVISIEIFPPKEPNFNCKIEKLTKELEELSSAINPSIVSVTYGAGGSCKETSNTIVKLLKQKFSFNVMPHLTCVCSNTEFIEKYLKELDDLKIENILALRGDEPLDIDICYRDFKFASELVDFIKQKTDFEFETAVAGYPEGHIKAPTIDDDIDCLKTKVDKGAKVIYTQLFFDNACFYNYIEKLEKKGINTPVVAGILPIVSFDGLLKMSKLSGVNIPKKAYNIFEKYKDSKQDIIKAGIEWATNQVHGLIENNVSGLHFYTLNKAYSTVEILKSAYRIEHGENLYNIEAAKNILKT